MFRKPFYSKSQVQLKSSEKRKIISELQKSFPALTEEDVALFNKGNLIKCKLTTATDENVDLYTLDSVPMFFNIQDSNIRLPTVFMAWKFPNIAVYFTTNNFVCDKLKAGANLFLPGMILEGIYHDRVNFKKNDVVFVNTLENKTCVCVGLSCISFDNLLDEEMCKRGGVGCKILHVVGDHLYKMAPRQNVPLAGPPTWVYDINKKVNEKDNHCENEQPMEECIKAENNTHSNEAKLENENKPSIEMKEDQEEEDVEGKEEKMNDSEMLEYCFIKAAKTAPKTIYPILPATFYATQVLVAVPKDETLNIKKTKWKKFSIFLQEKSLEGLVKLQEMHKNEFKILGFNYSHPQVREFVDRFDSTPLVVADKVGADGQPVVQQVYSVSAATLAFFGKQGFKKRDELTRTDVRNALNDYINRENLQHPVVKDKVVLNAVLTDIVKSEPVLSRGDLLAGLLDKMSVQHKVSNTECGTIVHKGKMPMIEFELATRTGNKKVTLISNLESYGVDVAVFSKELQQKAAASTTITANVPGKKGPQVQVQGNQILLAVAILKEKNIQEKFMRGLEKAPKAKKDKKK